MTRSKTPSWVRKGREMTEENTQNSVTREELEHLFAYELRVANADVFKLKVYDREGQKCKKCSDSIMRIVQNNRSSFFCPSCQQS